MRTAGRLHPCRTWLAAARDGAPCTRRNDLNFSPAVSGIVLPTRAPVTTSTGTGTITTCVFPGGSATTGTFRYSLTGNPTCISAQKVAGTLDFAWADGSTSTSTVTSLVPGLGGAGGAVGLSATVNSGRFNGDQVTIANIRDPLASLTCLTTSLTFIQP
ncbi:hypothetical protein [Streptomyces sp. NPDC048442]|uniref:hypothetical protein n=1 Tax=Streptomyces sp. NPDC048442 TaxID=3154823 RepID=UPI0034476EB8